MGLRSAGGAALLLGVCAASVLVYRLSEPAGNGPIEFSLKPRTTRGATPGLLALGKRVYEKQCVACHGTDGRGEGEAAYLLYPKPRDFTAGAYRLVSTWERGPTDGDLF